MTTTKPMTPAEAGLEIRTVSGPRGEVNADNWPHIAYDVEVVRNGKTIWAGSYRLGVGHVKKTSPKRPLPDDEHSMLETWKAKPGVEFKDKRKLAHLAAKLAADQNVKPELDSVIHSLILDGEAHFDSQTFEDWCANLGYDSDSRKAEAIWKLCDETGRRLISALGRETVDQLREWASNY